MPVKIYCSKCGREHDESRSNCCWLVCKCGATICGGCGSTNIVRMDPLPNDEERQYWCCKECADCGLQGCAMCI